VRATGIVGVIEQPALQICHSLHLVLPLLLGGVLMKLVLQGEVVYLLLLLHVGVVWIDALDQSIRHRLPKPKAHASNQTDQLHDGKLSVEWAFSCYPLSGLY
jgi:hypothetical protein